MYAVVNTGGKQHKVKEGSILDVEKLDAPLGEEIVLDKVLMVSDENGDVKTGNPTLDGKVVCEVLEQARDKKIKILKYKKRKDYRKRIGHRQYLTKLKVKSIQA